MGKVHAEATTLANRRDWAIATLSSEETDPFHNRSAVSMGKRSPQPVAPHPNYVEMQKLVNSMRVELDALRAGAARGVIGPITEYVSIARNPDTSKQIVS